MNPNPAAPNQKRRLKKLPLALLALAVIVGALLIVNGMSSNDSSTAAYYETKRRDFLVTIVEGGTLEAVNEVVVRNEVEGSARVIYLVPEGTFVKKGDLVVQLQTAEAEEKVNQQEIAYQKAQSLFVQAENDLEIQKSVIQSSVDAADLKLEFAKIDLDKYLKGERLQKLRDAEIKITTARSSLLLAQEKLDWSERLYAEGFETKNAVAEGSNSVLNLKLQLEQAQTNLWMISTFDLPKDIRTFQSAVEEAEKELKRTIAQGDGKLAQLTADLITQSNSLVLTQSKLENDREQLDKSKIYAPQDGLVVYAINRSRFSSESMIEEGAMVRERQELIKLPDTSAMKVEIKIHESHVNKISRGQPAYIVLDPLPDKRFKAQVAKVGVLPDTQSRFGNPNLKVYNTEIIVKDQLPDDVKPGVSARAEIVITNIPNALTVPVQAVTSLKGKPVVFVRDGDEDKPVSVEVGLFNTKFIEIVSGLDEGQQVLLSPPFDVEEKDLGGAIMHKEDEVPQVEPLPPEPNNGRPGFDDRNRDNNGPGNWNDRPRNRDYGPSTFGPGEGRSSGGESRGPGGEPRRPDGEERPRGGRPGFNREEMLKRFDKNGDGLIDDSEREEIRKQFGGGRRDRTEQ